MHSYRISINEQGRVIIPAKLRKSLDIKKNMSLIATIEENSIKLTPIDVIINEAQALVRYYCKSNKTEAIDDLFEMRCNESKKEQKKLQDKKDA